MEAALRARVFISCGQQKNTDELEIANRIAEKLHKMGFDPYIAVAELSLKGVKENIFRRLSESEYFIFVDFRRERLDKGTDEVVYRGSLFSHQELAVASFLDIEVLPFQEAGVKKDDGILRFIQANCVHFESGDRHLLPDVIAEKVREQGWSPSWRNELELERESDQFEQLTVRPDGTPARFYHIKVWNHHKQKVAHDCAAYLERMQLSNGTVFAPEPVEFKWKGIVTPRISIFPQSFRYLDAFHVFNASPNIVHLGIDGPIVDYSGYFDMYKLEGPGDFVLTYIVLSDNFPPTRAEYRLHIGSSIEDIEFCSVVT